MRHKISQSDFLNLLNNLLQLNGAKGISKHVALISEQGSSIDTLFINEIEVDSAFSINDFQIVNLRIEKVWIKNCKFNNITIEANGIENICIEDSDSLNGIKFNNLNKILEINKISIINSKIGDVELCNSMIEALKIIDKSIIRSLKIDESRVGGIYIKNSVLNGLLLTNKSDCLNDISISDNSILGPIEIRQNSKIESLSVRDKSEVKFIRLIESSCIKYIFISNYSKTGNISIFQSTVVGIQVEKKSKIFGLTLEYLSIDSKHVSISDSYVEKILLALDKPFHFTIENNSEINFLVLEKPIFKEIIVQIFDTKINSISILSLINLGIVIFSNVSSLTRYNSFIKDGAVPFFDAAGRFVMNDVEKKSEFKIINSDLGKTQFIGCDLAKFDSFVFLNSKMLEVFIADSKLPNADKIGTTDKFNLKNNLFLDDVKAIKSIKDNNDTYIAQYTHLLKQQRLALTQFKKISETMGDMVSASEFLAFELETHRQHLKFRKPKNRKERWNVGGERINLYLNKFSNYYGNNWIRAVFITIVCNFILFHFYCLALGFRYGSVRSGTDRGLFWKLLSFSFEFLNPLRKADFLNTITATTDWGRVIDYLSRIIMAYFVYQTIQAFRKHGKKT